MHEKLAGVLPPSEFQTHLIESLNRTGALVSAVDAFVREDSARRLKKLLSRARVDGIGDRSERNCPF
jgi:hypothetical protein